MRAATALGTALQAAAILAATGAFGLAAHQPWIFPSLGPTAVLQATPSTRKHAKLWNACVGHACGIVSGCLSVLIVGASRVPGVLSSEHLAPSRLAAAVLAMLFTVSAMYLLRASHAPAASTTLLFAEGSYRTTWHDVLLVIVGVTLTVSMGEVLWLIRMALADGSGLHLPGHSSEHQTRRPRDVGDRSGSGSSS